MWGGRCIKAARIKIIMWGCRPVKTPEVDCAADYYDHTLTIIFSSYVTAAWSSLQLFSVYYSNHDNEDDQMLRKCFMVHNQYGAVAAVYHGNHWSAYLLRHDLCLVDW